MPSRISGACNGCRTKKQKCSGDRSGCTQCQAAGIQCTWPEQRKRGPAKGYIEGLEHRLHEAESLLLSLLSLVTPEQLNCATDSLNAASSASTHILSMQTRDSQSPGPRNVRSSPPVLNKKTGIEYWESFPLDSVENIRRWQEDCATHSTNQTQSSFRNSVSGEDLLSREMMQSAFHSAHNSRPSSVELSAPPPPPHARAPSGAFRSMSTDSYRSGTSTPIHAPQHSHSQTALSSSNHLRQLPPTSQQQPQPQPQAQQQNWNSMSLFSSLSSPGGTTSNTPNSAVNNVDMSNEALLLQSFADSTWAQSQSLNNGMGTMSTGLGTTSNAMNMEGGPMEVDTGFFTNDVQRRLFW